MFVGGVKLFLWLIFTIILAILNLLIAPYKKFYDQDFPLYNQLKVFGCTAICRIPKEKRKKLQPQGKKLIFMGFDKDWTYKLYDETTNTMTKCRNVIFFEEEFKTEKTDNFLEFQPSLSEEEDISQNSNQKLITIKSNEVLIQPFIPRSDNDQKNVKIKKKEQSDSEAELYSESSSETLTASSDSSEDEESTQGSEVGNEHKKSFSRQMNDISSGKVQISGKRERKMTPK